MTTAQHFSTEPTDARRLFLSACLDARLPVASFEAPRSNSDELRVHIDVAHAGQSTAPTVIVVCPGTRMAEGLCASGIQTTLLRTGLQIEMPGQIAMVLVHSVVPAAFEVATWVGLSEQSAVETEWDDSLLAAAEVRFNEDRQQAKTMTQEESEHQQWCRQVLANIAGRFLSRAQHLIFLDVHTGSGPYGKAEVVSCHMPGSHNEKRALELFGARAAADGAASLNFQGPVARGLASSLPDRQTTSLVLEFGCYSLTTVLDSLLSRHETEAAGGGRFDRMFYPDAADWRDLVWDGAEEILRLGFQSIDLTDLAPSGWQSPSGV
jgi:hypothetical protein